MPPHKPEYSKGLAFKGLAVTATPIGNMGDISPRAQAVLSMADIIACEDTRHTGLLLSRLGITPKKLVAYHDHSQDHVTAGLIDAMASGQSVALVSDAGTPLISDPGYGLVSACIKAKIPVTPIPGASAVLSALAASGLPTDRFYFGGFLPQSAKKKQDLLKSLSVIPSTLVFYESPKRLTATLEVMAEIFPDRPAVVAREITKLHESFYYGTVESLYQDLRDQNLKGEAVLMLGPVSDTIQISDQDVELRLQRALADGYSRRDAAAMIADQTGLAKKDVYKIAIALPDLTPADDR